MKIQVLGSGCPKCKKLFEITVKAVKVIGLQDEVEYVTGEAGTTKIIELGAMQSPVLAINDNIALIGAVPDINKIIKVIQKYSPNK